MELTDSQKADARKILVYFFGIQAENWTINTRVIELLGEMLNKERACTRVMDTLPRPGMVDRNYILRQLRSIARRLASGDHSYQLCKLALRLGWERTIRIASQDAYY